MARAAEFKLSTAQIEAFHDALIRATGNKEVKINKYLHETAQKEAVSAITKYIPLSRESKRHAKNLVWYKVTPFNLAFKIETKPAFYYLWFVNEGSGTSKKSGGRPFADLGIKDVQDSIFDGMLAALTETYEEEINHV